MEMAHLITMPLEAPPDTLRVNVAYYDEDERAAFVRSMGRDILDGPSREIVIPTPDFCTYYLYYKLRSGVPGYDSHDEVARRWAFAVTEFDGQVEFADGSIRLTRTDGANRGTSERLGEAVGLSVASRLHSLHDGDWRRVPETSSRKTFDFERAVASDGHRFILLEAKGSSVDDNRLKPSTVSGHKQSIKEKKGAATRGERANSILYGTIGVLDGRPNSIARCWLVDPPADVQLDPVQFKVLSRLEYIARWVSFLGPRSQLAAALQTRLASLRALKDISPLDGISLRTGGNVEFPLETFDAYRTHNPWFASRSVVADGTAGGNVYAVGESALLFIAIREQLIVHASTQKFETIGDYAFPAATLEKTVQCAVSQSRFERDFSPFMKIPERRGYKSGGYYRFSLDGHVHYCQSGLVVGVLPIPDEWRVA